jgi:membrane-associated protein
MTSPERDPGGEAPRASRQGPQLPWGDGKARRIDIVCWGGIVLCGLWALATLPFVPSLIGTNPVLLSGIRGSTTSMITAGAFARVGDASIVAALLAPLPVLMVWGPFFWLAGWLWGTTGIELLTGQSARSRRTAERVRRHAPRWIVPLIIFGYVLPVPSQLIWVAAGWIRMRLPVFLVLNAIAACLWVLLCVGLGFEIGQGAVDVAKAVSRYALWVTLGLIVVVFAVQLRRGGGPQAR